LSFRTNLDEWVPLDEAHPLRTEPVRAGRRCPTSWCATGWRLGLRGRLLRAADLAVPDPAGGAGLGVWSAGRFWPLGDG
jgi:hypothetical protein